MDRRSSCPGATRRCGQPRGCSSVAGVVRAPAHGVVDGVEAIPDRPPRGTEASLLNGTTLLGEFLGGSVTPANGPGDQWLDVERTDAAAFRVFTLAGSADLRITVAHPGAWVVGSLLRGRIDLSEDGTSRRLTTGDLVLVCGGRSSDLRYRLIAARLKLVRLPDHVMEQVGGPPPGLHPGRQPASSHWDARAWRRLVGEAERMMGDPLLGASPLIGEPLARLLAATAVTVLTDPPMLSPVAGQHRRWPATVERALDFMESGADLALDLADIARAAEVTPRALQVSFRRHLGTSPMAHLRRIRLELARSDLKNAVPGDGTTVSAVAARWGFTQPGRFAVNYRAAFDESPRDTLRS